MHLDVDLFTAPGGDVLASVADLEPGPLLMSVLLAIDPSALDPADAVEYVALHERVAAWWASQQAPAIVAAAGGHPVVEELLVMPRSEDPVHATERRIRIADAAREELATALRWPLSTTQDAIDTSRLMAGPLAATQQALAEGAITTRHVRVVVEAARRLPGADIVLRQPPADDTDADRVERDQFEAASTELQQRVLRVARRSTVSSTRRCAERAVLDIDAAGAARRRAAARRTADAYVVDEPDGMSVLIARMATEQAHACLAAVGALARDPRLGPAVGCPEEASLGERRAAAMRCLLLHEGTAEGRDDVLPRPRLHADVQVVIDLATLLALGEEVRSPDASPIPTAHAELLGVGALNAGVVRDLLTDPTVSMTVRRLVTDPLTGHLLDYGRRSYAIPDRLREFIVARDRTCRFPGCQRRADRCQIDHAVAWDDGGGTGPPNLGALCTRHHQLKTHGGWTITSTEDSGACTWMSPQGRVHGRPAVAATSPR